MEQPTLQCVSMAIKFIIRIIAWYTTSRSWHLESDFNVLVPLSMDMLLHIMPLSWDCGTWYLHVIIYFIVLRLFILIYSKRVGIYCVISLGKYTSRYVNFIYEMISLVFGRVPPGTFLLIGHL